MNWHISCVNSYMKLYIISNRLPVKVTKEDETFVFSRSEGGLATGLDSLQISYEKHWIGWPGICVDNEEVMLGAASCGLPVLLDGFLSYAAALAACQMSPAIKPYVIPSHLSAEKGARIALSHLGLEPYLNMDMRLGEGSGAALAMSIIEAACAIYNNMGELAASNIVLPGNTTSDLNS